MLGRELPGVSSEFVILFAVVRAHMAQLPRKERKAFLDDVEDSLETQAALANVARIRSAAQDVAVGSAASAALAWWRAARPAMQKMPVE